jgi:ubiquinone/menaquinone biosynthesis C-methylase UbiE
MSTPEEIVQRFYDKNGGLAGHDYHADSIRSEVNGYIHRRFLDSRITPGGRILEIGAGVGRFTVDLIRRGATVVVTDISEGQLAANEEFVAAEACESGVISREQRSITDLSAYDNKSFDGVLAYGGPLSYAFMQDHEAMRGVLRVTKAGGFVVGSVMSKYGMRKHYYENRPEVFTDGDEEAIRMFEASGDWTYLRTSGHICKLYTWQELVNLVHTAEGYIFHGSASNHASMMTEEKLAKLRENPKHWSEFLRGELLAAQSLGSREGGTHILYDARPNRNM